MCLQKAGERGVETLVDNSTVEAMQGADPFVKKWTAEKADRAQRRAAAEDEERKAEILPYLIRLRDETGVPMVYVSHDPAEMLQLASQIVLLKRGRVAAFGGAEVLALAA